MFPIQVPPLRARKGDIPLLVWHALGQLAASLGKKIERVPVLTMERLVQYDWPGNIRELRNVLERAVILSPGPTLLLEEFTDPGRPPLVPTGPTGGPRALADVERDHILRVLEACQWRVRGAGNAAEHLALNASTLYSRMKKLGIRRSQGGGASRLNDASPRPCYRTLVLRVIRGLTCARRRDRLPSPSGGPGG